MKTLDLNAYGVSEMTKQEIMETNGGQPVDKVPFMRIRLGLNGQGACVVLFWWHIV